MDIIRLKKYNQGFSIVEISLFVVLLGFMLSIVFYVINNTYRNNKAYINYCVSTAKNNVFEIIKADSSFCYNLKTYYKDKVDLFETAQAGTYKYIYIYYDEYNNICSKDMATFYIQIMYSINSQTKYNLYSYTIYGYWYMSPVSSKTVVGQYAKIYKYEKK